jgi:hypothetical protein
MRDGTRARFTVTTVDDDALVSKDGRRYARSDISELTKRKFSPAKTMGVVGIIVATPYVLLGLAWLAER